MGRFQWIDNRISLPGDSETERSQKRLAVGILAAGAAITTITAINSYMGGLTGYAFNSLWLAAMLLVSMLAIIAFPAHHTAIVVAMLLGALTFDVAGHIASGGYLSGFVAIQWAVLVPVLAVLLVKRRYVILIIVAFVAAMIAGGLLDPQGQSDLPDFAPAFIVQDSTLNVIFLGLVVSGACLYLFNEVERYRRRADDLLLNILPGSIAQRLKESPGTIADGYTEATVLFADIVDFTTMSSGADPVDVVRKLNEIFSDFDRLAASHGLEKIKTIGDAYMVAAGLPERRDDHCQVVAAFALEMLAVLKNHTSWTGEPIRLRIGINCGPVVAGVIGEQKFIYDLWGDAVNVASRMESNGLANVIQVTKRVKEKLDGQYAFEKRGEIVVKGKGPMITYLLRP